jgi:DnaK suppressor protein
MTRHLTSAQKASLQSALEARRRELDHRVEALDASRVEHTREVPLQDGDDAQQRETEREIDMAMTDLELRELGAVNAALQRLQGGGYGICADCGAAIPFDRLKLEPQAQRCVACAGKREKAIG